MDYDEMLDQAIEETPAAESTTDRFEVPNPEIRQEGHATVFENFQAVCNRLARDEEHVVKFLRNELGTSAHIDESGRARLAGDFSLDRITDAVDAYTETYVRCPECGLPDTQLRRGQGVTLLRCEACGAQSPTNS
jgi:translation initiation factor 2 subunit 2